MASHWSLKRSIFIFFVFVTLNSQSFAQMAQDSLKTQTSSLAVNPDYPVGEPIKLERFTKKTAQQKFLPLQNYLAVGLLKTTARRRIDGASLIQYCAATLISQDTILTSRKCAIHPDTGRLYQEERFLVDFMHEFLLDNGASVVASSVQTEDMNPYFDPKNRPQDTFNELSKDLTALKLMHPVSDKISPIPLFQESATQQFLEPDFRVVSYRRVNHIDEAIGRYEKMISLDGCTVKPVNSTDPTTQAKRTYEKLVSSNCLSSDSRAFYGSPIIAMDKETNLYVLGVHSHDYYNPQKKVGASIFRNVFLAPWLQSLTTNQ